MSSAATLALRRLGAAPGSLAGPYARGAVRAFATEKEIAMRIAATTNIQKITSSMKMVSAAKLRLDELRLKEGRPFQKYLETIMPVREDLDENEYDCLSESQTPIFVCLTSDKGLCGGVNSVITRQMKKVMAHCAETSKSPKLFIVGDKGRAQMRRIFEANMAGIATEVRERAVARVVSLVRVESQEEIVRDCHRALATRRPVRAWCDLSIRVEGMEVVQSLFSLCRGLGLSPTFSIDARTRNPGPSVWVPHRDCRRGAKSARPPPSENSSYARR
jgi:hypothetical protein